MQTRKLPLIVACLVVASLLAIWVGSWAGARTLTLAIVDQGTDKTGQRSVLLLITNVGPFRICYPDGFEVQPKGAAAPAYVRTTNLWLEPGEDSVIPVVLPVITAEWCGVVNYYAESPWNRSKIWLSVSSIGQRLPSAFTSVRGGRVEKSLDASVTAKRPNKTVPVNAAVPSRFNSALSWHRVTERQR